MPPPPVADDDSDSGSEGDDLEQFHRDIADIVDVGAANGHSSENLLSEIKTYKMAQNKVLDAFCRLHDFNDVFFSYTILHIHLFPIHSLAVLLLKYRHLKIALTVSFPS